MDPETNEYICFLEPARAEMPMAPTPEEGEAVAAHFAYYEALHSAGTLILAGRTLEAPHTGIMIFRADSEQQARQVVASDPAVASGVMNARLQQYRVALKEGE